MALTQQKPKPVYKCTQSELYAICSIGWRSFKEHLSEFNALKGYYTIAYATAQLTAINDAKHIDNYYKRNAHSKQERIILRKLKFECLIKWQDLKHYILSAFPKQVVHIKLDAAGADHYLNARNDDWEVVSLMMQMGSLFISNHTTELTANDNMPAAFAGEFEVVRQNFDTQYEVFMSRRQLVREDCTEKIEANNLLYKNLLAMFRDGVHIFRWNAAIRERFIWKQVKWLVSSEHGTMSSEQ